MHNRNDRRDKNSEKLFATIENCVVTCKIDYRKIKNTFLIEVTLVKIESEDSFYFSIGYFPSFRMIINCFYMKMMRKKRNDQIAKWP